MLPINLTSISLQCILNPNPSEINNRGISKRNKTISFSCLPHSFPYSQRPSEICMQDQPVHPKCLAEGAIHRVMCKEKQRRVRPSHPSQCLLEGGRQSNIYV